MAIVKTQSHRVRSLRFNAVDAALETSTVCVPLIGAITKERASGVPVLIASRSLEIPNGFSSQKSDAGFHVGSWEIIRAPFSLGIDTARADLE